MSAHQVCLVEHLQNFQKTREKMETRQTALQTIRPHRQGPNRECKQRQDRVPQERHKESGKASESRKGRVRRQDSSSQQGLLIAPWKARQCAIQKTATESTKIHTVLLCIHISLPPIPFKRVWGGGAYLIMCPGPISQQLQRQPLPYISLPMGEDGRLMPPTLQLLKG